MGEIDAFIYPSGSYDMIYPPYETNFVNYTRVEEVIKNKTKGKSPYLISPRKVFSGIYYYNYTTPRNTPGDKNSTEIKLRYENR